MSISAQLACGARHVSRRRRRQRARDHGADRAPLGDHGSEVHSRGLTVPRERRSGGGAVTARGARFPSPYQPDKGRSAIYRTDLAPDSCWYALCATIIGNRGKPSGESRLRKSIDSASECNLRPARTFTSTFAIHCSHWQWSPKGGPQSEIREDRLCTLAWLKYS